MTRPAADNAKMVWNGQGQGAMVLAGASPGAFQAFPSELDGQIVRYSAQHRTATEKESGFGQYTHGTTTLTRLYRTFPVRGGSLVNFSPGPKDVLLTNSMLDFVEIATADPTSDEDIDAGYLLGNLWINTSTDTVWILVDHGGGSPNTTKWVRLDEAISSVDQWDILGRIASGAGAPVGLTHSDLTEETTPLLGDWVFGWRAEGEIRKYNIGNWPAKALPPLKVTSNASPFALATTSRLTENAYVTSHQANVIFQIPLNAAVDSEWRIMARHDGCTVAFESGSPQGILSPDPCRIINGGLVIVTVTGASIAEVRGELIVPMIAVSTKTYDLDDYGQEFAATGTQTFNMAAASIPNGWYVNIFNDSGSNITIDGLDNDHTLPARGAVLVKKYPSGPLVCVGTTSGSGLPTVLDAA